MIDVAHVRTRRNRPTVPCELKDIPVKVGDYVIVDVDDEKECGQVAGKPFEMDRDDLPETYAICLRKAESDDLIEMEKNEEAEEEAFRYCQERISSRGLDMKLARVEYLFDRSKMKFYYTSEGRVDFRDLVRDLAQRFRTRIEMRQVGVRDQAGMVGGFGICGLTLCCSTFLRDFAPITIKMAKEQNLALNPSKISGQCGRLLCCLRYEYDHYHEARRDFPKINSRVKINSRETNNEGTVGAVNILKREILVRLEEESVTVPLDDLTILSKRPPRNEGGGGGGEDSRSGRRSGRSGRNRGRRNRDGDRGGNSDGGGEDRAN